MPNRTPTERQLAVLRLVARARGHSVSDADAADECADWGWLMPAAAFGWRLTRDGWRVVRAAGLGPLARAG